MKLFAPAALALSLTFSSAAAAQSQTDLQKMFDKSPIGQQAKQVEGGEFMVPGNEIDYVSFDFMTFINEKKETSLARAGGLFCKAVSMAEENRAKPTGPYVDMQTHINEVAVARVIKSGRQNLGFTPPMCVATQ